MVKGKTVTVLAIETSCDETAAAVVSARLGGARPNIKTESSVVRSQVKLHARFGGVVPEAAARAHVASIVPVVERALRKAKIEFAALDYLAVTQGPGLIPSLLVGVEFTKTLGLALNKPVVPVNHLAGHLYSPFGRANVFFPHLSLIVSGGHTLLVLMESSRRYRVVGSTVDDAAGEAFDKVARLLSLPYPGGPEVSKLALSGRANVPFPRPMLHSKNFDLSFAGLKTAVLYHLQGLAARKVKLTPAVKADVCASFEEAVTDVLVQKAIRAVERFGARSVSLSGGVSANRRLQERLKAECVRRKLPCFVPSPELSTDNAEMIAVAAVYKLAGGYRPKVPSAFSADPNLTL